MDVSAAPYERENWSINKEPSNSAYEIRYLMPVKGQITEENRKKIKFGSS
jgi:hypothetical protein